MENEGQAVNRPPLFKGQNYDYWKQRMIAFFDACHIDMWDVVENGDYLPIDQAGDELPRSQWTEAHRQRYLLNSKAKNAIMCALSESEYEKVHSLRSAKKMWDTLALAYEGTSQVKRSKLSLLVRQYELFTMEETETIETMFGRFQTIVNNLRSLGKTYDNYDHIDKILRSLPRQWRPQVTALRASKDLTMLSIEELLGTLKVHELELKQDEGQKKKSIALSVQRPTKGSSSKALKVEESSDEASEEENSDEDEISFISRKIQAMWRKKGGSRSRHFTKRFSKEPKEKNSSICFECKKPGHFKAECPSLQKEKKNSFLKKKKKGLMATWEDMDLSSSEEEDEEEANICLMADFSDDEQDEEVNISDFTSLEEAYNELLANSSTLSFGYNELKKKFSKITKEFNLLKDNYEIVLKENEMLKSKEISETTHSNEVPELQKEVTYLKNKLSSFVNGTENLNKILSYQRSPFDRSGLGFSKEEITKTPKIIARCNYCNKTGHESSRCFHRPVRKASKAFTTNQKGPKNIWVPKSMIIPVADLLDNRKKTPIMVPGQWLLTTHDGRKVYVPKPPAKERWMGHLWWKPKG